MFILSSVMLYISIKLFVHGKDLFSTSSLELSVQFDCARLPITYCCTTRVRIACDEQCSSIHCDSNFYKQGEKFEQRIIGQQTIYKSGVNDGDTGNFRSGGQMKRTSRQPSSRNIRGRNLLPIPTSSNERESLVDMSSDRDHEVTADVISSSVTVSKSTSDFDRESFLTTSEPEELIITEQSLSTFTPVQEKHDLNGKFWELRSFNIVRHVNPALNWLYNIDSNTDLVELEKAQCGTAPEFSPCIPISQANFQFEQCCRNKLIPQNCLHMCKYDVTQAEITTVFSTGLCGLLYVVPIVQCASNGHDNSECCGYKQVIAKSAPQCEIFCRGQEIAALGLQHLICRKVMNELIACHLSGLRN